MMLDKDELEPKHNAWFSLRIESEGYGWARFRGPDAIVEGPARFQFNEYGESTIELSVGNIKSKEPLPLGLFQLFRGNKVEYDGKSMKLGIGGAQNECIEFEITTSEGTLSAHEHIHYSYQIGSNGNKINLSASSPKFIVAKPSQPKYWVIPLSNYIPEFRDNHADLDNHPLRIFPTPSIPQDLSAEEKSQASWIANRRNRLVVFEFNHALGFIEPLPDFDERKESLISRRAISKLTSVMVGEVGENSIESEDLKNWFPFDFLPLLGLAGGTEVGAPWIEFRDKDGILIRRVYSSLGHPLFSKGHAAIDERFRSGAGDLLSKAHNSPRFNQSFLRVAIKNIVRAGLYTFSIEEKFRHVFLVFDNFIEEYGLGRVLPLQRNHQRLVNAAIAEATKDINELSRQVRENGDEDEAKLLAKIVQKIAGAKKIRTGFGPNVIDLMNKFNLVDHEIAARYYQENPRIDNKKWADVIPYYRGIVMHRSYFNFREGKHDIEDVNRYFSHLHDILVRIVFKILEYDGTYQPTVISMATNLPVDWVKYDTDPNRLGY